MKKRAAFLLISMLTVGCLISCDAFKAGHRIYKESTIQSLLPRESTIVERLGDNWYLISFRGQKYIAHADDTENYVNMSLTPFVDE